MKESLARWFAVATQVDRGIGSRANHGLASILDLFTTGHLDFCYIATDCSRFCSLIGGFKCKQERACACIE